jgi:hypothetical protein
VSKAGAPKAPPYPSTTRTRRHKPVRGSSHQLQQAKSLPDALDIARSLRPFKRQWPQGARLELDVDTMLETYARIRKVIPAFRPAPERWFDVVLVVDDSPNMAIWADTVAEFADLLHRLAAFRHVKIERLSFEDGRPRLTTAIGLTAGARQLSTHGSRRLILVFTDGLAEEWSNSEVWQLVRQWAATNVTTLVTPLSARLWLHTGLDQPSVTVTHTRLAATSIQLRHHTPSVLRQKDPDAPDRPGAWTPVTAISLAPHSVGRWARTLMRGDPAGCDALLVPSWGKSGSASAMAPRPTPSAEEIVSAFHHIASPESARLAILCSLHQNIDMPLVQIIRQEVLPEANVNNIAEMIVGGLLSVEIDPDDPAATRSQLRFRNGVDEVLRRKLTYHDAWLMFDRLTDHARRHEPEFGAPTVAYPDPLGARDIPADLKAIAEMAEGILDFLDAEEGSPHTYSPYATGGGGIVAARTSSDKAQLHVEWSTWAVDGSKLVTDSQPSAVVRSIASIAYNGRLGVVSGSERKVRLWDIATGESLTAPEEMSAPVRAVATAELDGQYFIASGGLDQVVRVWNPVATASPVTLTSSGKDTTGTLAIGQVGGTPIVVGGNRTLRIWDIASATLIREIAVQATSVAFGTQTGNPFIVSGGSDNLVRLWDPVTGTQIAMMHGHRGPIRTVAAGPVNDILVVASAGSDATIRLWDAASGMAIGSPFHGHSDPVTSVAIGLLANRPVIASGSHDRTLRIWDALTGVQMHLFDVKATVHCVVISANRWVVAGTDRGIVSLSLRSAAAGQ